MWWAIFWVGITCLGVYGCNSAFNSPAAQKAWADIEAKQAAEDAECAKKVELVSQVKGLKLYRTYPTCNGRPIYFSAGGTHTTHSQCHLVGKVTTCHEVDEDVSNAR